MSREIFKSLLGLSVRFDTSYDFVCISKGEGEVWLFRREFDDLMTVVAEHEAFRSCEAAKAQLEVLRLTEELQKVRSERDKHAAALKRVECVVKEGVLV